MYSRLESERERESEHFVAWPSKNHCLKFVWRDAFDSLAAEFRQKLQQSHVASQWFGSLLWHLQNLISRKDPFGKIDIQSSRRCARSPQKDLRLRSFSMPVRVSVSVIHLYLCQVLSMRQACAAAVYFRHIIFKWVDCRGRLVDE